jgi:S1-C subfamily serine protease
MRNACRLVLSVMTIALGWGLAGPSRAASLEELVSAVVQVKTTVTPDGQTLQSLGRDREGSGVIIDEDGLILTIGYLMVEAQAAAITTNAGRTVPATVVGYDHVTGFGVLRAIEPLKIKPLPFGRSADVKERDPVLIASYGGTDVAAPAYVAAKREFAGNWEYLLDEAIFTTPPHPAWSGAALISRDGKLIGIGSLIVGDAAGNGSATPGNMFVPIDGLLPILGDLIADGRVSGPGQPWLGVVAGAAPRGLADFYRKVWATGAAGATVPLDVEHDGEKRRIDVKSMNRLDHLKLKSTL